MNDLHSHGNDLIVSKSIQRCQTVLQEQKNILLDAKVDAKIAEALRKNIAAIESILNEVQKVRSPHRDVFVDSKSTPIDSSDLSRKIAEDAQKCSSRLIGVTCRLLTMWYNSIRAKVAEAQREIICCLNDFDEQPSEETLHKVLACSRSIAEKEALLEPCDVHATYGPPGNPFSVDHDLVQLFGDTISDTLNRIYLQIPQVNNERTEEKKNGNSSEAQQPFQSKDLRILHGIGTKERCMHLDPNRETPRHVTGVAGTNCTKDTNEQSGTLNPSARYATPGGSQQRSNSGTSSYTRTNSIARSVQQHNDSSRVRSILGGSQNGDSQSRSESRSSTPSMRKPINANNVSTRLGKLREQLEQMEQQLQSPSMWGNGSRNHALKKQIQSIRAQIIREERDVIAFDQGQKDTPQTGRRQEWTRERLAHRNYHSPRPF